MSRIANGDLRALRMRTRRQLARDQPRDSFAGVPGDMPFPGFACNLHSRALRKLWRAKVEYAAELTCYRHELDLQRWRRRTEGERDESTHLARFKPLLERAAAVLGVERRGRRETYEAHLRRERQDRAIFARWMIRGGTWRIDAPWPACPRKLRRWRAQRVWL